MLFNFYTIDSCFLAETWHITSRGMFAGSCIGVILLVMSLEFLRRSVKEYDRYLVRQHMAKFQPSPCSEAEANKNTGNYAALSGPAVPAFRPNIYQQAIRALLHMVQFAVAYFIML